ncbi:MAG: hypothetical protein KAI72_04095, partial [Candidatus Pacebacteria bacterium]|nr:hypothetical protein [Candidatus Paceibacterota bacterium]
MREETDISGYDPFKQDKKIISHSMDFSPVINRVSSKVHTIITSGEKELLESLTNKGGGSISIRLSKSLLKFFNEDIINNELKDNYLEPGSKMNIQVIFFNKNSFSVMLHKEKGIPSNELFIVFNKALLRKRFIPKKVTGNIY